MHSEIAQANNETDPLKFNGFGQHIYTIKIGLRKKLEQNIYTGKAQAPSDIISSFPNLWAMPSCGIMAHCMFRNEKANFKF